MLTDVERLLNSAHNRPLILDQRSQYRSIVASIVGSNGPLYRTCHNFVTVFRCGRVARGICPPKLAFPWIPLAESGLFNGLQRIQIKKSRGPRFLQFVSAIASCPRSPDSLGDPDQSGEQQQYSTHSDFRKDNVRPRSGRWFMCQPVPHGWRWWPGRGDGIRTPSRPRPGKQYFVGRIIQGGTQSGRSQVAGVLCATRARLN